MAVELRLRVTFDDDSTVTFDHDGDWRWRRTPTYRTSTEPPELESVAWSWEFRGAAILTEDGSATSGWTRFLERVNAFGDRANPIAKVELYLLEAGVETVVHAIDTADGLEGLRLEELDGQDPYDFDPQATHLTAFPVTLRFAAVELADREFDLGDEGGGLVAGVVGFEATLLQEPNEAGLVTLTQDVTVTTRAGVDARPKAELLGLLQKPSAFWAYQKNDDSGVTLEVLDAKHALGESGKVPSKVRAVCVLRQFGVRVGDGGPGDDPGSVSVVEATRDDGDEVVRAVTAEAVGPAAEEWVAGHAIGDAREVDDESEPSARRYRKTWTIRTPKGAPALTAIQVELTGGHQAFDYEPVIGGYEPLLFEGALLPWVCRVTVAVSVRGGGGTLKELPLPPLLPTPWRLDYAQSSEGAPTMTDPHQLPAQARWGRQASLVFLSPTAPKEHPWEWLQKHATKTVETYYLPKA